MKRIFLPVHYLFAQSRRPGTVFLGGLVLLTLLGSVTYGYLDNLTEQTRRTERELCGLTYIGYIRAVVEPLQEYRGLLSMHASAPSAADLDLHRRRAAEVEAAFDALQAHADDEETIVDLGAEVAELRREWERLRAAGEDAGSGTAFDAFTPHIGRLIALHRSAINASGLDLDPVQGTYHLIQILDLILDLALEPSGQVRAMYSRLLAAPAADERERAQILGTTAVVEIATARITHNVALTLEVRPDLAPALEHLPASLDTAVDRIRALIDEREQPVDAEHFFISATAAIRSGYLLYDAAHRATREALEARLTRERAAFGRAAALSFILGIGLLYLIGGGMLVRRERMEALEALRLAARVFESAGEGILVTDPENRIQSVNPAFTRITGYSEDEAVGRQPNMLQSGRHDENFYRAMWQEIQETGYWEGEIWDRRKNGEVYPEWLTINVIRDPSGQVTHHVAIFHDMSERKASEERIHYLAEHDFLTGLPNRALFQDRLTQAIAHAERSRARLALLFIDLDRFKNINDSLGHQAGDLLLQETARRLTEAVRTSDTVCRQGGDEFLVMLAEAGSVESVARIARKISESLSQPCRIEGSEVQTTVSIGISIYPDDGRDMEALIRNADTAMYHAKEHGRNLLQFFTREMDEQAAERFALEQDLRKALENAEFRLRYQPQVDASTGEIVGIEALASWESPERGLVPPDRFIPVAEESGLIFALGEWVLREACRQNRAWQDSGLPPVPIAVNLSALQVRRKEFKETVETILRETGLDPRYLELEIREDAIMSSTYSGIDNLERLRATGVTLSIDDFGTGYSNLSSLKRFPLHKLKIDQSFVREAGSSNDAASVVRAVIALARSLGLRVIAEGVETAEELSLLCGEGCAEAQGYLFSHPVPAGDMAELLAQKNLDYPAGKTPVDR